MSVNNKRVFYVKYLAHPIYAEMLAARPDVRLDRLENESRRGRRRRRSWPPRMPIRSARRATSWRATFTSTPTC